MNIHTLRARLAIGTALYIGQQVGVLGGVICGQQEAGSEANCAPAGSVVLEAPAEPLSPTAVIDGPLGLAVCDDLLLSGARSYGGGVFPLEYSWILISHNLTGVAQTYVDLQLRPLRTRLNTSKSAVEIPASTLAAGTSFTFGLKVRTILGALSSAATLTVLIWETPRVVVSIDGKERARLTEEVPLSLL